MREGERTPGLPGPLLEQLAARSSFTRYRLRPLPLESRVVCLAGADADDAPDVGDEDLSVADLAGLGGLQDRFDDLIDEVAAHSHFDAGLRDEVDDVLGASVQLGVATLPSESLHFSDGHAGHAYIGQRGTHVVELERFDDRCDQFHVELSVGVSMLYLYSKNLGPGLFCSFHATRRRATKSLNSRNSSGPPTALLH